MRPKIRILILIVLSFTFVTVCIEEKIDNESAIEFIQDAMNKVYESKESLTTRDVQENMIGTWTIVEAPADMERVSIPVQIDEETLDTEWTTMFITACNKETSICKDLRIFKDKNDKLFIGSETDAFVNNEK